VAKCRHLLNLDSDPEAVDEALGADPLLAPLVKQAPGRRVAGATDGFEIAVRAILGQQVSLGSARRMAGGLVERAGSPLEQPLGPITHTFPEPGALAELAVSEPTAFPMPASRRRALQSLSEAVAAGKLIIDPGADPAEVEEGLLAIPGVGPWTSSYVAMRAIGDPDAFLPTDLGLRHAASRLGLANDPASLTRLAERWRPWRAYALAHLWSVAGGSGPAVAAPEVAGITSSTSSSSTSKGESAA
jgi:AraC family transcriptional regulator of adaptative response / DNA-3-methyladenine glycosylase II